MRPSYFAATAASSGPRMVLPLMWMVETDTRVASESGSGLASVGSYGGRIVPDCAGNARPNAVIEAGAPGISPGSCAHADAVVSSNSAACAARRRCCERTKSTRLDAEIQQVVVLDVGLRSRRPAVPRFLVPQAVRIDTMSRRGKRCLRASIAYRISRERSRMRASSYTATGLCTPPLVTPSTDARRWKPKLIVTRTSSLVLANEP